MKKDYSNKPIYVWRIKVDIHINHAWKKLRKEEVKELKEILKKEIDKYMVKRGII